MVSPFDRYVIAFNGEIYNHLTLRHQLELGGLLHAPCCGHADIDTLLAAIEA